MSSASASPFRPGLPRRQAGIALQTMSHPPDDPPLPFDDAHFFQHNSFFPSPPPLPSSADLFSPSEATDFFGFLENFTWDLDLEPQPADYPGARLEPAAAPQQHYVPSPPNGINGNSEQRPTGQHEVGPRPGLPRGEAPSTSPSESPSTQTPPVSAASSSTLMHPKPLLSTPQKRLNHIMSEQKRRNAIRNGYLELTTLLSPAGAPPGSGMPTRGRPKGSGGRGRGTKGKSGILFRAREYIRFLEEGRDALLQEVQKVEAAASVQPG